MQTIIVGIDPSLTGTAVCVAGFDPVLFASSPIGSDAANRILRYCGLVHAVIAKVPKLSTVFIEGYSFGSKGGQATDRAEYGGILRYHLCGVAMGCEVIEVPPTSLKKWATGKGNGDKTPMIAAITKRYGVEFRTNDEYDAYALARLGEQYSGLVEPQNQAQREVIEKLKAGPVVKSKRAKA